MTQQAAVLTIRVVYTDDQWSIVNSLRNLLDAEVEAGYITGKNSIVERITLKRAATKGKHRKSA